MVVEIQIKNPLTNLTSSPMTAHLDEGFLKNFFVNFLTVEMSKEKWYTVKNRFFINF